LRQNSDNKTAPPKKEGPPPKKDCDESSEDGEVPPPPPREEEEEVTVESILAEVCKDTTDVLPNEFKTPDGKFNFNPAFGRTNWTDPVAKKNKTGNFSDFIKFFSNFTGQDFNTPFKNAK
jgi:hypothetical protein